jgi:hypothetical protein
VCAFEKKKEQSLFIYTQAAAAAAAVKWLSKWAAMFSAAREFSRRYRVTI